ncbi:sigma factor-like helix-turn-helix DNA-binding protein [Streptomyces durhamensis]|uniref:sigma factor-like helix-turn-helix DNA-binding protein n=1 Tax=Streptomyces durhamensis TaxID=68194 RepID=UPI00099D5149
MHRGRPQPALADHVGFEDHDLEVCEALTALKPVVAALPKRDRKILAMRFSNDMTQREIAAELGLTQMHASGSLADGMERVRLLGGPRRGSAGRVNRHLAFCARGTRTTGHVGSESSQTACAPGASETARLRAAGSGRLPAPGRGACTEGALGGGRVTRTAVGTGARHAVGGKGGP